MRTIALMLLLAGLAGAEPTRRFYDPALDGDGSWMAELPELLTPLDAAGPLIPEGNRARVRLKGNYQLPMPAAGEVIRLRLYDCQLLHLGFFGDPGTLISRMHNGHLTAFQANWPLQKTARKLPPEADPLFHKEPFIARVDSEVNFDWSGGGPSEDRVDNFAVRWQGFLRVPKDGSYGIAGSSDDGMRIFLDGKRIVDSWAPQSEARHHAEVVLSAGLLPIAMEYYEAEGQAVARLEWQPPGAAQFAAIPSSALRTSQDADADPGLYGHYVLTSGDEAPGGPHRAHRLDNDAGQWHGFGHGNLDIRYQDGAIIIARGDIVLLRAPHPTPSPHIKLHIHALLLACHKVQDAPLPLPTDYVSSATKLDASPSFDSWMKDASAGSAKSALTPQDDGGIRFHRPEAGDYAHATTRIPTKTGGVITFHLQEVTHGAGVYIDGPFGSNRRQYLIGGPRRLLCQDPGNLSQPQYDGLFMPESFWLRFEIGFNLVVVSASIDGKNWWIVRRESIQPGDEHEVEPEIILGLILARSNAACGVRIGPPEVRRWQRLEALAATLGERELLTHRRSEQRRSQGFRLFSKANQDGIKIPEPPAAIRELIRRCGTQNEDRDGTSGRWFALDTVIKRIVERKWADGNRQIYSGLKAAWRDSLPLFAQVLPKSYLYPDHLNELHLFDLWSRGDWEALWYETERDRFHRFSDSHEPDRKIGSTNASKMVEELRGIAAHHLGLASAGRMSHPLSVETDRDSQNLLAEFAAALSENDLVQAGRLLTGDPLPQLFTPSPHDADLLLPIPTLLRQRALSHAPLRAHLQKNFDAVAGLRLTSARFSWRQRDFAAIRDQFPGTQAAMSATLHLADRQVSVGQFASARALYQHALAETPGNERLQQKAALSETLVAESAGSQTPTPAPSHRKFRMELLHVPSLSRKNIVRSHNHLPAAGFTKIGDRIIVNHLSSIFAISGDGKRVLWHVAHEKIDRDHLFPTPPVCLKDVVIASAYSKKEERWALVGRSLNDGKPIWRRHLPGHAIGNPVLHNGSVLVWSYERDRGHAQLHMHRIAPWQGSVLHSRIQASFIATDRLPDLRSAIQDGSIYCSLYNTVLRCDLDGQRTWMRRLPRLGAPAMGGYINDYQPTAPVLAQGQLLVQARNSPGLFALDPETGSRRWTHWQRDMHQGMVFGDGVCVVGRDGIETLNLLTGEVQHYLQNTIPPDSILMTADQKLLVADIIQKESPHKLRELRWLDPLTGATQASHIPQHKEQHGLRGTWSDGTRIFGFLVNNVQNDKKFSFAVLHP